MADDVRALESRVAALEALFPKTKGVRGGLRGHEHRELGGIEFPPDAPADGEAPIYDAATGLVGWGAVAATSVYRFYQPF